MGATFRYAALVLPLLGACQRGADEPPRPPPAALVAARGPAPKAAPTRPCMDFRNLKGFLPKALKGYERDAEAASMGKYGEVSLSSAERSYVGREGTALNVRIMDTSMLATLAPAIEAAASSASDEGPTARMSALKLAGGVGFVRYEPDALRAEANILVGHRYIVDVTATGVQGTQDVRQVTSQLDLAGLAKLR